MSEWGQWNQQTGGGAQSQQWNAADAWVAEAGKGAIASEGDNGYYQHDDRAGYGGGGGSKGYTATAGYEGGGYGDAKAAAGYEAGGYGGAKAAGYGGGGYGGDVGYGKANGDGAYGGEKQAYGNEAGGAASESIQDKVAERLAAKRTRDFTTADRLRDELESMGVTLNDKENSWYSQDGQSGTYDGRAGGGGYGGGYGGDGGGYGGGSTGYGGGGGGYGGGQTGAGGGSSDSIQEKVSARLQAKRERDFATADSLRDELKEMGVTLDDKENMWYGQDGMTGSYEGSGGGGYGGGGGGGYGAGGYGGGGGYGAGGGGGAAGGGDSSSIQEKVSARLQAKRDRDFTEADRLRDELKDMGVTLDDKENMWYSDDGQSGSYKSGGGGGGYGSGAPLPPGGSPDAETIQWKVQERLQAKRDRDFEAADRIRDELRDMGVSLEDKENTWSTEDGKSGTYSGAPEGPSEWVHRYTQGEKEDKDSDWLAVAKQDDAELYVGGKSIDFEQYDVQIEISGENVPDSINSFSDLRGKIPDAVMDNIQACKFTKPTPVQKHSFSYILAGRDVMACAQTGSGKTAAFMFPMIAKIIEGNLGFEHDEAQRKNCPIALIIAPTRELALQIHDHTQKFVAGTKVQPICVYGGIPAREQLMPARTRGMDILIGTTGRLKDLASKDAVSFEKLKFLCLDEADRMLDMGFEPAIRELHDNFYMPKPGERQTLMFSATFPTEIQELANEFLSDYIFFAVGRVGMASTLVKHDIRWVEPNDKWDALDKLLKEKKGRTMVFVKTKRTAEELEEYLWKLEHKVCSIHGDRSQEEREAAMKAFRTGVLRIIVATDVAARGIDVENVLHVINFDMPEEIDAYTHRCGRTGRAGKKGRATTFFNFADSRLAGDLHFLLTEGNMPIPDWLPGMGTTRTENWRGFKQSEFGASDYRKLK